MNCYPSSIRFKQDVETIVPGAAITTLNQLRSVSFEYKGAAGTTFYGFIAEEVEQVDRRLVSYGLDGLPYSVNYLGVVPLLTQGLQEIDLNLQTLASTTATSTLQSQSFITGFFNNIFARITTWLADATNGITDIFANTFRAKEKICVDDQCLTKDDIRALLESLNRRSVPAATPASEPVPTLEPEPVVSSEPVPEIVPEPAPEPVSEPAPEPAPEPVPASEPAPPPVE
jgi:hypothetical protein